MDLILRKKDFYFSFEKFFNLLFYMSVICSPDYNIFNSINTIHAFESQESVISDNVLDISLSSGQFVPDLTDNPNGYTAIRVVTTGSKKITTVDYDNLRASKIPTIDLSQASGDYIPKNAFTECDWLTEFKFPNGVTEIKDGVYENEYTGAFSKCTGLTSIELPSTLVKIGVGAFNECIGLTGNLIIPNSVEEIKSSAFRNCTGLNGTLTLSNNLTSIEYYAFGGCTKIKGSISFPDTLKTIGDSAFYNCTAITGSLIFPDSVESIGLNAFRNCKALSGTLKLPSNITEISYYAFGGCTKLSGTLEIPDGVLSIGDSAFYNCTSFSGDLILPNSIVSIGQNSFRGCTGINGEIEFSDSLETIAYFAFGGCTKLSGDLILPDSLKTIGNSAFYNCTGLTGSIVIPNNVESIGTNSFRNCSSMTGTLTISSNLKIIEQYAFAGNSKMTGTIDIPDSVTTINAYAFHNCAKFNGKLIIPETVVTIGNYAFDGCSGLDSSKLSVKGTLNSIGINAFRADVLEFNLSEKQNVATIAADSSGESTFDTLKIISETSLTSDDYTNIKNSKIKKIDLYDLNITTLPENSFTSSTWITNIVFPKNIKAIEGSTSGSGALEGCIGITDRIVIPDTITDIGIYAFNNTQMDIIIAVKDTDLNSNYRKSIIDNLPKRLLIDLSYNLDINNTWLKEESRNLLVPILKEIIDEAESNIVNSQLKAASLYIPNEENIRSISILRNGTIVDLPVKKDGKYIFEDLGVYKIVIESELGLISNIEFEIIQEIIASNYSNILDLYFKPESIISISIDTSNIVFNDFEVSVTQSADIKINVESNTSYDVCMYLVDEIYNFDKTSKLNHSILNVLGDESYGYQGFKDVSTPITLFKNQDSTENTTHVVKARISNNLAFNADVYKTQFKIEIYQI